MPGTTFAKRLGVTRSRVTQIEQAEVRGDLKLSTLERAADALGCDLVYVLLPRSGSLETDVQRQAHSKAVAQVSHVAHTMALENQASEPDEALIQDLADAITRSPQLWQ